MLFSSTDTFSTRRTFVHNGTSLVIIPRNWEIFVISPTTHCKLHQECRALPSAKSPAPQFKFKNTTAISIPPWTPNLGMVNRIHSLPPEMCPSVDRTCSYRPIRSGRLRSSAGTHLAPLTPKRCFQPVSCPCSRYLSSNMSYEFIHSYWKKV